MDTTVGQHLGQLESRVQLLTELIIDKNQNQSERQRLQAELSAVSLAIAHFEAL